ncbi:MAG: putative sterol carrier protein [Natronomonas sp.]|jgi:putative sterol carrier protein|uniref:SCP2 sterol-binding domain-containing protein n=1 Tax=Natronomonas sp. TaxID=2184060 RepID=UPI003988E395
MAQQNLDDESDVIYFPSQAWFAAYKDRINENEAYAEQAADWGVDFNGDFIFEMRNMPVDDLDIDAMPDDLRSEIDQYVNEENGVHVGYSFVGLEGGKCTDAYLIESPDEVDVGFRLTADNETWKDLMRGNLGVVDGMMSGHFDIEGDMQKVMQYSQAAVELTESAASIDAAFADETFSK